ncbi:hypothetical protein SCLCIDRAFT_1046642 [Scleroderma citrinum Foug A]|uniref:Uncharacterized protein n=1 Tax=Scleroderma citrinum Foug A TaxID=1036808 RepID=A0A0C3DDR5_9AGAM|nr:hypothetical protein SCLCIDRAFT_1046642 [Scleroderma citrinum Foug A]
MSAAYRVRVHQLVFGFEQLDQDDPSKQERILDEIVWRKLTEGSSQVVAFFASATLSDAFSRSSIIQIDHGIGGVHEWTWIFILDLSTYQCTFPG